MPRKQRAIHPEHSFNTKHNSEAVTATKMLVRLFICNMTWYNLNKMAPFDIYPSIHHPNRTSSVNAFKEHNQKMRIRDHYNITIEQHNEKVLAEKYRQDVERGKMGVVRFFFGTKNNTELKELFSISARAFLKRFRFKSVKMLEKSP